MLLELGAAFDVRQIVKVLEFLSPLVAGWKCLRVHLTERIDHEQKSPSGPASRPSTLLAAWMLCVVPAAYAAHPLDEWHERAPLPTSQTVQDIAHDGDHYVVLVSGRDGRALVSRDLEVWNWRDLGIPKPVEVERIAFRGDQQVAITDGGVWCRSTWQGEWKEAAPFKDRPTQTRVLNGEFWAWSEGGLPEVFDFRRLDKSASKKEPVLYRSPDGLKWEVVPTYEFSSRSIGMIELIYAEEAYLLAAGGELFRSVDGTSWNRIPGTEQKWIHRVAYANGMFLASGGQMGTSPDGENWRFDNNPLGGFRHVSHSDGHFVALIENDHGGCQATFSKNGIDWSKRKGGPLHPDRLRHAGEKAFALAEGGGLWVANAAEGGFRQVLPLQPWNWMAVAASEDRVVIGGQGGHVAWSDDAVTFHPMLLPDPATVADIMWVPELKRFIAVGGEYGQPPSSNPDPKPAVAGSPKPIPEYGRVWISSDGKEWATGTLPASTGRLTGIAWNGKTLVLCGRMGRIVTSPDGTDWTARESGTDEMIHDVAWGGGNFVATASEGIVLNSKDGVSWTIGFLGARITSIPGPQPVYGNGTWMIAHAGSVFLSRDAQNWSVERASHVSRPSLFAFGEFIASDNRRISSSVDGVHWSTRTDKCTTSGRIYSYSGFHAAAPFRQQIVYVGWGGRISVSGIWK